MAEIEKVIQGIERCFHGQECCRDIECPYYIEHLSDCCCLEECQENLKADALAMLKEQDAVEPEKEFSGSGVTWWYVCGNCKTAINPNDKYCHECGKRIDWEGR